MPAALILCGSARKDGVTETMCRSASATLESMGYDAVAIRITDDISHCRDCGFCRDGGCVLDDAMSGIYGEFAKADLLVLATPVHFSGPSSLIKAAVDRFQPYWYNRDLPHPSAALGLVCAGSESPRFGPTESIFRAFCATVGMRWLGQLEFPDTDRNKGEGAAEAVDGFIRGAVGASAER